VYKRQANTRARLARARTPRRVAFQTPEVLARGDSFAPASRSLRVSRRLSRTAGFSIAFF